MVIERAELDVNLSVRKRVIQILSHFLDIGSSNNTTKKKIMQILISKWHDSSN
jgi:hypothetical protein